jgi:hypothetical protein
LGFDLNSRLLIYGAGSMLFIIFALNLYVGLVDRNMFMGPNVVITPHYYANWVITIVDIILSGILFMSLNRRLLALSGIVWPLVYIGLILLDIESRLCVGAPSSSCFPTVSAAESYLLLGKSSFVTVYFWQYTFLLILSLLVVSAALSFLGLYLPNKEKKTVAQNVSQDKEEQESQKQSGKGSDSLV